MSELEIRAATQQDASLILHFIKELAEYERAANEVVATVSDIESCLFAPDTTTEAIICTLNNTPVGFAVYFLNFSTWLGRDGLYLEDLYVTPDARGYGAGKQMLKHLAVKAVERGCGRFEWNVLDWNEPAIRFYESIGAEAQHGWTGYRLQGTSLVDFASR